MDSVKELAKQIAKYIKGDKKTKAYDTAAEVKRIVGNTAYVHIPGGVPETPAKLTIDAKVGDTVQVRVANSTAWLVGNSTAPPTDDAKAKEADAKAGKAMTKAKEAETIAEEGLKEAQGTSNYFWHVDGSGAESGAHVTEVPQAEFESNPSGGNLLMQAVGIYIRKGLQKFAQFLASGLTVYNGNGETIAHLGYGPGKNSSGGTSDAPYYDIGYRNTANDIGNYSTVEGYNNSAENYCSHAEGHDTQAEGYCAHAEGYSGYADGYAAHSEGDGCHAYGGRAHAEGGHTTANAAFTHAEGYYTYANYMYQHVCGKYNNLNSQALFQVGNGTSTSARKNAFEVYDTGHIKCNELDPFTTFTATGTVTINANSGSNVVVTGIVPTGYTPIAVQGIETAHNQTCLIGKFVLTSNGASITLRNVSSSNYSNMSVTATILCTSLQ